MNTQNNIDEQPTATDATTEQVKRLQRDGLPCEWPPDKRRLLTLGITLERAAVVTLLDVYGKPVPWARRKYARTHGVVKWDVESVATVGGVLIEYPGQDPQRVGFPQAQTVTRGATVRVPIAVVAEVMPDSIQAQAEASASVNDSASAHVRSAPATPSFEVEEAEELLSQAEIDEVDRILAVRDAEAQKQAALVAERQAEIDKANAPKGDLEIEASMPWPYGTGAERPLTEDEKARMRDELRAQGDQQLAQQFEDEAAASPDTTDDTDERSVVEVNGIEVAELAEAYADGEAQGREANEAADEIVGGLAEAEALKAAQDQVAKEVIDEVLAERHPPNREQDISPG